MGLYPTCTFNFQTQNLAWKLIVVAVNISPLNFAISLLNKTFLLRLVEVGYYSRKHLDSNMSPALKPVFTCV